MIRVSLTTRRAMRFGREGIQGAQWYDALMDILTARFGADAQMFAAFLAATSPNTTVRGNVTLAMKAYMQYTAALPFVGYLPVVVANLERAASGQKLSGIKVHHFHQAIVGDPDAVAVDRWMLRAYGIDKTTPARMRAIIVHVRASAKRLGMSPRELQAAIWTGIKGQVKQSDSMAYWLNVALS